MAVDSSIEIVRIQAVLRDLLKATRGHAPMLQFEANSETVLRGVANRSGLLRLGLQIALAALEKDPAIMVHSDGAVTDSSVHGVIEVVLTEESIVQQPEVQMPVISSIGCAVIGTILAVILFFSAIGFVSVLNWLEPS